VLASYNKENDYGLSFSVARLKTKHKTTLVTHGGNWGTQPSAQIFMCFLFVSQPFCVRFTASKWKVVVSVSVSVSVECECECACWETCGVSHFSSFLRTAGFQDGLSPTRGCGDIYCSVFSLPQRRELASFGRCYSADVDFDVSLEYWLYKLDCLYMRRREK
jgi:hypothetical protein